MKGRCLPWTKNVPIWVRIFIIIILKLVIHVRFVSRAGDERTSHNIPSTTPVFHPTSFQNIPPINQIPSNPPTMCHVNSASSGRGNSPLMSFQPEPSHSSYPAIHTILYPAIHTTAYPAIHNTALPAINTLQPSRKIQPRGCTYVC